MCLLWFLSCPSCTCAVSAAFPLVLCVEACLSTPTTNWNPSRIKRTNCHTFNDNSFRSSGRMPMDNQDPSSSYQHRTWYKLNPPFHPKFVQATVSAEFLCLLGSKQKKKGGVRFQIRHKFPWDGTSFTQMQMTCFCLMLYVSCLKFVLFVVPMSCSWWCRLPAPVRFVSYAGATELFVSPLVCLLLLHHFNTVVLLVEI